MITLTLFISDHCSGCHPMMEKCKEVVSTKADVNLEVYNVDESDDNMNLARAFYIMSTPTTLIKLNNDIVDQIIGNVSVDTIEETLNKFN
jgi:thiol-disulfide isomerase/thioredoxin